jgi:Tfp pilus assembly protein PilF
MRLEALGSFAPASGAHFKLTPRETFLSVSALFAQYVAKLLMPVNLNFFYVFHPTRVLGWKSIAGLALLAVLISAAFVLRRTQPLLAFAVTWFLITLSPVLSIANVGENVFTERYIYIPSFGFSILAAWAWLELMKRALRPQVRAALVAGLAAIFVFYAAQTIGRIPDWRDDVTLYSKTAEQSPGSAYIQSQLGTVYYEQGNLDEALNHYERAVAIDPNLALAQFNLGIALRDKGQPEQAVPHVRKAVELDRGRDAAWTQYGIALANLKQWDEAAECYRNALRTQPNDPEILTSLGEALSGKGDVAGAMQAYRQAIAARPGNLDASTNLAILLMRSGSIEEAISLLATALQRSPDAAHADIAHFNLGICYEKRERWYLAAQEYERALQLNPDFQAAQLRLEIARQHLGPG